MAAATVSSDRQGGGLRWIFDARGLTFVGAVLLAGMVGVAGGLISARQGWWGGTIFAAAFITGCVVAALLVHREDLLTVAFMPPLLFLAVTVAVGVLQAVMDDKSVLRQLLYQLSYALSFGAPALWFATGATILAVLVRAAVLSRR